MQPFFANIVFDLVVKGGPMMWPILICCVAALAIISERFHWWLWFDRRCELKSRAEVLAALAAGDRARSLTIADESGDPIVMVIGDGLKNRMGSFAASAEMSATNDITAAERRLWVLSTFITLAPLLGLLGTVTGIMHSFHFVGDDQVSPQKVSGGIAEALIATAFGLGIAIFCLIPFNYFHRRVVALRGEFERMINCAEGLVESLSQQHVINPPAQSIEVNGLKRTAECAIQR